MKEEMSKQEIIMGNYIDWLYSFLMKMHSLRDYETENFYEKDRNNISNLHLLYDAVMEYAQRNDIMPKVNGNVFYYVVKYQDLFFDIIEVFYGTSEVYGCQIETKIDEYIDFDEIKNSFNKEKQKIKTIASQQ